MHLIGGDDMNLTSNQYTLIRVLQNNLSVLRREKEVWFAREDIIPKGM